VRALDKLFLASSNPGKLEEFRALAQTVAENPFVELELLPGFNCLSSFEEHASTFAENAVGKALHYSRLHEGLVLADDSGLAVPALGGAPGVRSARYAGANATNSERIEKLLGQLNGKVGSARAARFVCAIALAEEGRAIAVVTDRVDGEIADAPQGSGGFGYDPVFYFPPLRKTFAELSAQVKNLHSHRGKAFRKLLALLHPRSSSSRNRCPTV
jgi:XTP/dITP diphosphohydrolase